jgi:hypothetical protein
MRDSEGRIRYSNLVLSGGGAYGAFGAGFLSGWTESGERPVFRIVTGISTGALIGVFAFLGSNYDLMMERAYTTHHNRDIYRIRNPFALLSRDSLAHTRPLEALIRELVTWQVFNRVAEEHRSGRRFFVATANLDAQRPVVWNMGAIASSDKPGALELFRKVLLASAAIPVAFPPVYFPVRVGTTSYDEMHVDGGTVSELFLPLTLVDIDAAIQELGVTDTERSATIYVIRNDRVGPAPEAVPPRIFDIAGRSFDTLIKSVALADLQRLQRFAAHNDARLLFVGIPQDAELTESYDFDPMAMKQLFQIGRELALSENPWRIDTPHENR